MSQALLLSSPSPPFLHDGRPATTSLDVSKFFRKRHDAVLRDLRNIIANCPEEFTAHNFVVSNYMDNTGRSLAMYIIFRDGFTLLAMGYTGPEAMRFKLAYIEAFNCMEGALPAAPRFDEAAMLELAAEIREAQQQYYRTYGCLCSRLITMSIPVFTALESRVYKQAPDRPFSGTRVGAQWERYFTERMTAALHSLDDRLPDEKNPAMLLLEYARAMSAR